MNDLWTYFNTLMSVIALMFVIRIVGRSVERQLEAALLSLLKDDRVGAG
jgi:hypothetical protein